jgi:DNA polymerase-3 subunit beta
MKLTVSRDTLAGGLQAVVSVVPARSTFPILTNMVFEATDDRLILATTDLDISVTTRIKAEVAEPGAVTLPAKRMADIVRELPDVPIDIEVADERLSMTAGRSSFKMTGTSKDEYPELPEIERKQYLTIEASLLRRSILKTMFAVSTDEARPVLTGALWQIVADEMRMVTTDGHRLALFKIPYTGNSGDIELNVPVKGLVQLSRLMHDEGDVEVRFEEARVAFYFGETVLTSRLIEGQFPDYERVIPYHNDRILICERSSLMSVLRRAMLFANPHNHLTLLHFDKDMIEFVASTPDTGEVREQLPCEYDGGQMEIAYNAAYMLEVAKNIETDEIRMTLSGDQSAGIVYPIEQKEGEELLYLLMPIRLGE